MSYVTPCHTVLVTLQILISGSSALDMNSHLNEGQPVEYVLYDKYTRTWTYFPVVKEKWNFDGKLKLIVHGFNTHRSSTRFGVLERQLMTWLGELYSERDRSLNVVIADWSPLATGGLTDYENVAKNVGNVGTQIAEVLVRWKDGGAIKDWNMVHILGFSLGAHVAGIAGDQVWRRTGAVVGRITGLDPAGPKFDTLNGEVPLNTDGILDKSDAQFVDIYHCNMGIPHEGMLNVVHGRLGSAMKAGHVDFYPQGGSRQSYACSAQDDIKGCSHKQCMILYAYGVLNSYGRPACPCESYEVFLKSACGCLDSNFATAIYMGDSANHVSTISKERYFAMLSDQRTPGIDTQAGSKENVTRTGESVPYLNDDLFEVQTKEGQKEMKAVSGEVIVEETE